MQLMVFYALESPLVIALLVTVLVPSAINGFVGFKLHRQTIVNPLLDRAAYSKRSELQ